MIVSKSNSTHYSTELQRLLLVGLDSVATDRIQMALPSTEIISADDAMSGLVRAGRETFQALLISISAGSADLESMLKSYRKVSPDARIVLAAGMWDEPVAIQLASKGLARDYIILPVHASELIAAVKPVAKVVASAPAIDQPTQSQAGDQVPGTAWPGKLSRELAELIYTANLGLQGLLERICWSATFLFGAEAAQIEALDHRAQAGIETTEHNFTADLLEAGSQIGSVKMQFIDHNAVDLDAVRSYLELLPGLIRLASAHHELQELANTDPVTSLANRRHMMTVLQSLVEKARENRSRVTLVLFDMDDFKHYNDTYGHPAGDDILRSAAFLLRKCIRQQDLAARYGGDEFALLLWDAQSPREAGSQHPRSAVGIMNRFRRLLSEHHFPKLGRQAQGALTISGGLATFPWDARSVDELIEKADQALLEAKRSGKNRVYLVGQGAEGEGQT